MGMRTLAWFALEPKKSQTGADSEEQTDRQTSHQCLKCAAVSSYQYSPICVVLICFSSSFD